MTTSTYNKRGVEGGSNTKIQVQTQGRSIPDVLTEVAQMLNVMAPGLQVLEQGKGANPSSHQGIQQAFLRRKTITKKGKFTLLYDIAEKA